MLRQEIFFLIHKSSINITYLNIFRLVKILRLFQFHAFIFSAIFENIFRLFVPPICPCKTYVRCTFGFWLDFGPFNCSPVSGNGSRLLLWASGVGSFKQVIESSAEQFSRKHFNFFYNFLSLKAKSSLYNIPRFFTIRGIRHAMYNFINTVLQ